MTMTDTSVRRPTAIAPDAVRELTLTEAICLEAGCTPEKAIQVVDFFTDVLAQMRQHDIDTYHLTENDLDRVRGVHGVLDVIMPDDKVSQPGSAHYMLEQALLDPKRGEVALVHGKRGEVVRYCTVTVQIVRSS